MIFLKGSFGLLIVLFITSCESSSGGDIEVSPKSEVNKPVNKYYNADLGAYWYTTNANPPSAGYVLISSSKTARFPSELSSKSKSN